MNDLLQAAPAHDVVRSPPAEMRDVFSFPEHELPALTQRHHAARDG